MNAKCAEWDLIWSFDNDHLLNNHAYRTAAHGIWHSHWFRNSQRWGHGRKSSFTMFPHSFQCKQKQCEIDSARAGPAQIILLFSWYQNRIKWKWVAGWRWLSKCTSLNGIEATMQGFMRHSEWAMIATKNMTILSSTCNAFHFEFAESPCDASTAPAIYKFYASAFNPADGFNTSQWCGPRVERKVQCSTSFEWVRFSSAAISFEFKSHALAKALSQSRHRFLLLCLELHSIRCAITMQSCVQTVFWFTFFQLILHIKNVNRKRACQTPETLNVRYFCFRFSIRRTDEDWK